jgi:hypothetical protein
MSDHTPRLRGALLDVVDEQIRSNEPPETRRTSDRLIAAGHRRTEARTLIAQAVAVEVFNILKYQRREDHGRRPG